MSDSDTSDVFDDGYISAKINFDPTITHSAKEAFLISMKALLHVNDYNDALNASLWISSYMIAVSSDKRDEMERILQDALTSMISTTRATFAANNAN